MRALTLLSVLLLSLAPVQAQEAAQPEGAEFLCGLTALCVYVVAAEHPWTPLAEAVLSPDVRVDLLVQRLLVPEDRFRVNVGTAEDTWTSACTALARIGEPAVPALVELLRNVDEVTSDRYQCERTCDRVATILGMIGQPIAKAMPEIFEYLCGAYECSYDVSWALGKLGEPAIPKLSKRLSDESGRWWFVVVMALASMHEKGTPIDAAMPGLERCLDHGDGIVRGAVDHLIDLIRAAQSED